MKKIIRRVLLLFMTIFSLFIIAAKAFVFKKIPDEELRQDLKTNGSTVLVDRVKYQEYNVRYVGVNLERKELPLICWVHGAPGSLDNFKQYLTNDSLLQEFRMVAIDRPGYGDSNFGKTLTSIKDHAKVINLILKEIATSEDQIIVAGHSYGGPIGAQMAYENPEMIDHALLMAPALDPENEKIFWFSYLGVRKPFVWLAPTSLKVAAEEKFSHVAAINEVKEDWKKIQVPCTIVHGDKDTLVPYVNLSYAQNNFPKKYTETITLKNEGHLFPMTKPKLVISYLRKIKEQMAMVNNQ